MKAERNSQTFNGQVKFTKKFSQNCRDWRKGSIVLSRGCPWKLEVYLDVQPENASLTVQLQADNIKLCVCKEDRFMIEVNQSTVHFQPVNKAVMRKLKALAEEFAMGPAHAPALRAEVGLSNTNVINTPGRKPLFTSTGSTAENVPTDVKTENRHTESPQRFTSMKENKHQELSDDILDNDFKENINVTPQRTTSEKFLQRGLDISRQNLEALGAKTFYSSASQHNSYSASGGWLNSAKRPGLMPYPTPSKKPRLSNSIPYSMKARTTAEEQKQQHTLQGFSNLGNTCYMNAILQSLFGLDTLVADLLVTNRKLLKTPSPQSLYYALAKLLYSRKQNMSDESRRDLLRKVKGAISASAKRFSGCGQHDAHEFLGQVLDQLKEEVVKINKSTPSPVRNPTEEKTAETDYINPATVNFEFEVMHTIICQQCQEEVSKVEQFHDVSVDVPKRKDVLTPRSLQDSLSIFFRKEEIEYTCEKCGHNKSEVTHKFTRLPRVFIIHLKRYSYDQTFLRNTKMAQSVKIPSYITLQVHCEESTQPAFPVQLQHVTHSKENTVTEFDEKKDETPKRKLDFPGFRFNKKGLTPSTAVNGGNNTGSETEDQVKKPEEADALKPLDADDKEDSQLAKAIQMSLKDQEERELLCRDYGEDNESNFQKVLEMSLHEDHSETKTSRKSIEDLSEEQQLELAIQQSLMEADPYHHGNNTYIDDITGSCVDHTYSENYDIGPDYESVKDGSLKRKINRDVIGRNSHLNENISTDFSGSDSKGLTVESDDIIKICSKAVMSSSEDQPVSPGVFSDSGSDTLELFHESDGSQKLTKIEDRSKSDKENKNNHFTSETSVTSKYFSTVKDDSVLENSVREDSKNCIDKLPGGGKRNIKTGLNEDHDTCSSDTDDFELVVETETEYNSCTNKWYDNSLKSYSKLENRRTKNEASAGKKNGFVKSDTDISSYNKLKPPADVNNIAKNESRNMSKDESEGFGESKIVSNGEHVRKCQPTTKNEKQFAEENSGHSVIEITEISSSELSETDSWDSNLKEIGDTISGSLGQPTSNKEERTPNRRRFGEILEDIGKKMDTNSEVKADEKLNDYRDKLLEEMSEKLEHKSDKESHKLQTATPKEKERKHAEDKDIYDFQCNEDDTWISLLDDKENKHPKERPVLTDPGDVFGDGKTAGTDEVDSYIEENMDIPEIDNEKGDLPYSYKLVSVVSHMGISSSTGHYISDVYDMKKQSWFSFDDSHVSKITETEVKSKRERSGYIFFYMSKDVFDDLCLHQAVTTSERKKSS